MERECACVCDNLTRVMGGVNEIFGLFLVLVNLCILCNFSLLKSLNGLQTLNPGSRS